MAEGDEDGDTGETKAFNETYRVWKTVKALSESTVAFPGAVTLSGTRERSRHCALRQWSIEGCIRFGFDEGDVISWRHGLGTSSIYFEEQNGANCIDQGRRS